MAELLERQDDGDLVHQLLGGRDQAFDVLYRRYLPRLVRYCRRIAGAKHAEDLAQEALTRALAHLRHFDTRRPMWPWLKAIAVNLAIDESRKRLREVPDRDHAQVPHWDSHHHIEERPLLTAAMETLNARQRTAIRLRYLEDWEPSDAAAFLSLSGPAFTQLLYRARCRLRVEYARLSHGAVGLVLLPGRWARRLFEPIGDRIRRSAGRAGSPTSAATEGVYQLAAGIAAALLLAGGSPGPRPGSPASERPPSPPTAAAFTQAVPPAPAGRAPAGSRVRVRAPAPPTGEVTPQEAAGKKVANLIDPNRDRHQPEDAVVLSIAPAASPQESGAVYAVGVGLCNLADCRSVLFRSDDGGATWRRLPAEGLVADRLWAVPVSGAQQPKLFAMGRNGLQVSEDGGTSFQSASPGSGSHTAGPVAISPAFDSGDPSILIGATTLLQYRDDTRNTEPVATNATPETFEPAYSPRFMEDRTTFLGSLTFDPAWGTTSSTVHRCVDWVCASTTLEGQDLTPKIRVSPDGRVYAFTQWAIFVSVDGGSVFEPLALPWSDQVVMDLTVTPGNGLIASTIPKRAGARGGVHLSPDGGTSWRALRGALLARGATSVAVVGGRLIAALPEAGLACSTDGGTSWKRRCPK